MPEIDLLPKTHEYTCYVNFILNRLPVTFDPSMTSTEYLCQQAYADVELDGINVVIKKASERVYPKNDS